MDQDFRSALRASVFIHAWLRRRRRWVKSVNVPDTLFEQVMTLSAMSDYAIGHGWMFAAAEVSRRLLREVDRCTERMQLLKYELQERSQSPLPTESEICKEVMALRKEFDEVGIDVQKSQLSVISEPIVLAGIDLGRFQIELDCGQTGRSAPYRVVALEPNPSAVNSSVTHPHVQDEQLCEGDGRTAIRAALDNGRLTDFFLIVNQLLCTYARGSAFVELSQWGGVPCHACGSTTDEDDRYYCEGCEETVCIDCSQSCNHCDCNLCAGCMDKCSLCERASCSSCMTACKACGVAACPECLEGGICTNCLEEDPNDCGKAQDNNNSEAARSGLCRQDAGLAVQPHGVGQATVSA